MGCGSSSVKDTVVTKKPRFSPIPDRFTSIRQVQAAVRQAGLESSNLIIGVDFTKSNTWTGKRTFGGRNLHEISSSRLNPYQEVISIMARTLEEFDDDGLIPAFGFGDAITGDRACFPFHEGGRPSNGVKEVLERYAELATTVKLSGPTSFAPQIREAIRIVQEERAYHILVIIADGQVSDATEDGETAKAIIEASYYPLSIIVIGVGDGPWEVMDEYDDALPLRKFDNFQFVDFHACCNNLKQHSRIEAHTEARFALAALMEVPDQYAFIKEAGLLNASTFNRPRTPAYPLAPSPPSSHLRQQLDSPPLHILATSTPTVSVTWPAPSTRSHVKGDADILPPSYRAVVASSWQVAPAME